MAKAPSGVTQRLFELIPSANDSVSSLPQILAETLALYAPHLCREMSAGGVRLSDGLTEACLHAQEVLQTLAQNRMGKDNAAIEFSRTSVLQRTWPRLRSMATLYIVALTLPISILGCIALVVLHILRGGRLLALSPHPTSKKCKGYQPTAIVTGVHYHTNFLCSRCIAMQHCLLHLSR